MTQENISKSIVLRSVSMTTKNQSSSKLLLSSVFRTKKNRLSITMFHLQVLNLGSSQVFQLNLTKVIIAGNTFCFIAMRVSHNTSMK